MIQGGSFPTPHSNKVRAYWNAARARQKWGERVVKKGSQEWEAATDLQAANFRGQYIDRVYLFKSLYSASGFDVVREKKPQRNTSGPP